jgi:hypothetical protein
MVAWTSGHAAAQDGGLDILDGETLWGDGGQVTLSEVYRRKSTLYDGNNRIHDPLDQTLTESRTTLGFNYGARPELTLSLLVPYVSNEFRFDGSSGRETVSAAGLGDVTLLAKYRLFKEDWHLGSFNWTAFAGTELPTGSTQERDDGARLSPELQPGSGSWDPIVATAATYEQDRFKLNGVVLFEHNGQGAQDYKFGDLAVAELTPGYRFVVAKFPGPLLRADLGIQWRHEFAAEQDGDRLANSGGDTLLLKPGLVFWPRPWWGLVLSLELPVYRNLRGQQLGQDFGAFFSISYRF